MFLSLFGIDSALLAGKKTAENEVNGNGHSADGDANVNTVFWDTVRLTCGNHFFYLHFDLFRRIKLLFFLLFNRVSISSIDWSMVGRFCFPISLDWLIDWVTLIDLFWLLFKLIFLTRLSFSRWPTCFPARSRTASRTTQGPAISATWSSTFSAPTGTWPTSPSKSAVRSAAPWALARVWLKCVPITRNILEREPIRLRAFPAPKARKCASKRPRKNCELPSTGAPMVIDRLIDWLIDRIN